MKYFNIALYVLTYAYSTWEKNTSAFSTRFTSLPIPLFALLILLHVFFFFHFTFSTLQRQNAVPRSALFIIVYLERTCFIRQAVLLCPIDPNVSVD